MISSILTSECFILYLRIVWQRSRDDFPIRSESFNRDPTGSA